MGKNVARTDCSVAVNHLLMFDFTSRNLKDNNLSSLSWRIFRHLNMSYLWVQFQYSCCSLPSYQHSLNLWRVQTEALYSCPHPPAWRATSGKLPVSYSRCERCINQNPSARLQMWGFPETLNLFYNICCHCFIPHKSILIQHCRFLSCFIVGSL